MPEEIFMPVLAPQITPGATIAPFSGSPPFRINSEFAPSGDQPAAAALPRPGADQQRAE